MIKEHMSKSLIRFFAYKNEWFIKKMTKILFLDCFLYIFCNLKKTSDLLIPSFLMSDVSKSLRSLTKN